MGLLISFFLLAVIISFFCSMLESVILSISPAYVALQKKKGHKFGFILSKLKGRIDRPLAAILTLNTIANMVGATGVGAQTALLYGNTYVGIASAALTLIILVFSEIFPKSFGATYWKQLAPFCAYSIRFLIYMTYPFVLLSEFIHQIFRKDDDTQFSREEMIVTAEMGANEGSILHKESQVIRNLLLLDEFKIQDVMTPRSVVLAFEENMTVEEVLKKHKSLRFSRIPVYKNNTNQITGVVHRYKLLEASSKDQHSLKIHEIKLHLHSVPENLSVAAAIDQFVKRKEHLFLVVDEYGGFTGILTLEDCIETLLGVEIVDEYDSIVDMRKYALEKWRKKKQEQIK